MKFSDLNLPRRLLSYGKIKKAESNGRGRAKFSLRDDAEAPPELPIMRTLLLVSPPCGPMSAEPFGENKMRDIFRMRFRIVFPLKIVTFAANINPDQR